MKGNSLRWTVVASGFFLAIAACTVEEGDPDATGGSGGSTGGTGGTTATGGTGGGTGGTTATGGQAGEGGQGGTAGQGGSGTCSFETSCNDCIDANCNSVWQNCLLDTDPTDDGLCVDAAACLCNDLAESGKCADLDPCIATCLNVDLNDAFNTLGTCILDNCTAECVPTP